MQEFSQNIVCYSQKIVKKIKSDKKYYLGVGCVIFISLVVFFYETESQFIKRMITHSWIQKMKALKTLPCWNYIIIITTNNWL